MTTPVKFSTQDWLVVVLSVLVAAGIVFVTIYTVTDGPEPCDPPGVECEQP